MTERIVIREEPGEYRVTAGYFPDGRFTVTGKSAKPVTLTVRVEDVWNRLPENLRRYSYDVRIRRDAPSGPSDDLVDVAPDARIFLDFRESFEMEFT